MSKMMMTKKMMMTTEKMMTVSDIATAGTSTDASGTFSRKTSPKTEGITRIDSGRITTLSTPSLAEATTPIYGSVSPSEQASTDTIHNYTISPRNNGACDQSCVYYVYMKQWQWVALSSALFNGCMVMVFIYQHHCNQTIPAAKIDTKKNQVATAKTKYRESSP